MSGRSRATAQCIAVQPSSALAKASWRLSAGIVQVPSMSLSYASCFLSAQAERDGKIAKIAELQSQLDEIQLEASNSESTILALSAAIAAAEELLTVLTSEQAKYEEIDESGFTREPLAKELILELESRKEELVGQAAAQ